MSKTLLISVTGDPMMNLFKISCITPQSYGCRLNAMVGEELRQGCCVDDACHYGVERAHSDWKHFIPDVLVETSVLSGLIGYWKKDSHFGFDLDICSFKVL